MLGSTVTYDHDLAEGQVLSLSVSLQDVALPCAVDSGRYSSVGLEAWVPGLWGASRARPWFPAFTILSQVSRAGLSGLCNYRGGSCG